MLKRIWMSNFKEACDEARRLINGDMVDVVPHMSIRSLSIREIYKSAFEDAEIWKTETLVSTYDYGELHSIFIRAAHRASQIDQIAATENQCIALARLHEGCHHHPFDGNSNYILTKHKASRMITAASHPFS